MRYDDASQAGSTAHDSAPVARPDVDALAPGSFGPAGGNAITGAGTTTGASGQDTVADAPGHIVAVQGAGGAAANAGGTFQANGQYGVLSMDADGNFNYVRNAGTPDGVEDVFNYTLADADGQTSSTTLTIDIAKGGTGQAALNPGTGIVIPGVVNLPAGVQMSNIHVRGSDLIIDMPDGTQMVIPNGAVFVPQLVIGDVELPATNLAALLVDSEGPQAGAGQLLSSGGNFDVPVPPLDPGVPLGDLIPPTELAFPQPEFVPEGQFIDKKPEAGDIAVQLDDDDIPGRNGNAGGPGDDAGSPNAIASGTLPGSGGDAPISWSVAGVTLPSTGGFSTVAGPGGSILVQQAQTGGTVTVLTITVDAATGAFTVTENNPIMHPTGDAENNVSFVINFNVTDVDGDVAAGTLTINVDDDTPTVTVQAGPDAEVILTTHDALSIPGDGDPDSASTSINFSGVFSGSTVSPGADGAGPGSSDTYVLAATAQNSGLFSHGATINLFVVSGVVVGTTAASSGAIDASNTIFTVSTTNTGVVTLTQFQQIDHPIAQDPTPTGTPFADQIISMADGLVTLTRNITVVDNDGDQVTGSASVNIGANLHFTDDGPSIHLADRGEPTLVVDETDLSTNATQSFAANFAANFGADGPANAGGGLTYALSVSGNGADSGLVDTASGNHVFLFVESGQVVGREGADSTAAAGGPVVFTVAVDSGGSVTLDQVRAVVHPDATGPDTDETVTLSADSLVKLTATATDFDGDTASTTINIGTNLIFHDDGPSLTNVQAGAGVTLDETDGRIAGAAGGMTQISATSASAVISATEAFGADGPASSGSVAYGLSLNGGVNTLASGLQTAVGDFAITLNLVDATHITGTYNGANVAFTIAMNSNGTITVTQNVPLEHLVDGSTPAAYDDSLDLVLDGQLTNLVNATITITDGDGDTATGSAPIGGLIIFKDDGPSIDVTAGPDGNVLLTTQDPDTIGASTDTDSSSANFSGVFGLTSQGGADGAAIPALSFVLHASSNGVDSGLDQTGNSIFLYEIGGKIVGSTSGTQGGVNAGNTVFDVSVSGTGVVTLTQYSQIDHPIGQDPSPTGTPFSDQLISMADGLVTLTASSTVTDNDGDTATDSAIVNIGANLRFGDDGPDISAVLTGTQLRIDETDGVVAAGGEVDPVGGNLGTVTLSAVSLFTVSNVHTSADAPTTLGYGLTLSSQGVASGLLLSTTNASINLFKDASGDVIGTTSGTLGGANAGNTAFTVHIDSTTGAVTLTQFLAVEHFNTSNFDEDSSALTAGVLNVTITATDFDGDTDQASVDLGSRIVFEDDGPSINVTADSDANVLLTTQDHDTIGVATDTASSSAAFGGIFHIASSSGGSDGAANTPALSYVLHASSNGVDSGLDQTGNSIFLYEIGGKIVGSTSGTQGGVNAGNTVFDVAVSGTGVVTLTQYSQIDHPIAQDPTPTVTPFDDQLIAMADSLVTLTASASITDNDGDTATDSETVNIGANLRFADDGPVAVSESDGTGGVGTTATGNVLTGVDHAGGDANTTDGAADNFNADTPGTIIALTSNNVPGNPDTDGSLNFAVAGQYGTLSLNVNGDYTYTRTGGPGGATDVFTYTIRDFDGDTAQATLTITLADNFPVATTAAAAVDDDALTGGLANGTGDINANTFPDPDDLNGPASSEATFSGLLGSSSAGDGPATFLFLASLNGTTATVGQETVTYAVSGAVTGGFTTLTASGPRGVLFTVTITDTSTGAYTVTLVDNVLHPTLNGVAGDDTENNVTVVVPYQMRDSDGDNSASPGQLTITFNDDTPSAANDTDSIAAGTFGPATGNVLTGVDHAGPDANSTDGVADSFGADGPSTPGIIAIASNNVPANVDTDGSLNFAINGQYGSLVLNANGDYTYTRNAGTPGGVSDVFTYTIQDADGDKTTATLTINIGDSQPVAADGVAAVDDDGLTGGNPASTTGDIDANAGEAAPANSSEAIFHGQLVATGGDTNSFSFASMNGTSGTVGTETVNYAWNAGTNTLTATGPRGVLFTVVVNPTTGSYNLTLVDNVLHAAGGNETSAPAVNLTFTVTDLDGDSDTGTIAVTFNDDAPTMTHASNINIQNSGDVAASGTFSFNLGADGGAADNNVITSVTGAATVAGNAVTNYTISETSENATTASYSFSFDYSIGGGSTAHETGTLVFDKVAGTYTVDLANPIQGVTTILQTAQGTLFQGYEFGTSTTDSSQPAISVTQIQDLAGTANDIYVQFTSVAEPSSGTGDNNLEVTNWVPGADNPPPVNGGGDTAWNAGQLFNQVDGWVSTSNSANGVDGDTIQGGEVLDFSLVQGANPTGNLAQPASFAQASAMFLKFDGIGTSEDMIVILKLYDPNTNTYTTRAIMVENSDIQKGPGTGPGQYSGITLDNNDGLVIIESNDYNLPGENWVIVGAQIAGSDEGITGTAINLNPAIGVAGDSVTGSAFDLDAAGFQSDTDDGPFKISSIGFLTTQTTPQDAHLDFNVTVTDADGDSVTQAISADVTAAADSSTPIFPVVLDLNGDGAQFLGTDAGVRYDYGSGPVATAWASPQDGILAVDANHDGTVTNASEFVFGGNGTTDLQALAAYDTNHDGQLTSADAGFSNFVVWQDANSNGVADAGEVQTLAARGITAISLSTDGISYTAANGDVLVAGTGSYTNADGSTGSLADAIFQTATKDASDSLKSSTAMSSNAALIGAIAAAGLAASEPLAAHGITDQSSALSGLNDAAQHTQAFAPVALDAVSGTQGLDLATVASGGKSTAAVQAPLSHADDNSQASATLDSASHSDGPALSQLSAGTDAPASDALGALTAGGIAMPGAALLMAAAAHGGVAGDGQHNQVVAQVLADALHSGQAGPDISALVNAATGGGGQGPTIGDALASHAGGAVPIGDMAIFTGFTGLHSLAIMEQMAVHVDAASAHA